MANDRDLPLFLGSPSEIQRALRRLAQLPSLKIAVAFIGQNYWRELFGEYRGNLQVICWLKSPGTNPYAVEEMMKQPRIKVRQVDSMHAKVYLAPGAAAIVGSANLSGVALGDRETAGRHEAAVLLEEPGVVKEIAQWFDRLWSSKACVDITDEDIRAAKIVYDARPKDGLKSGPTILAEDNSATEDAILSAMDAQQSALVPIIGMLYDALGNELYRENEKESAVRRFFMLFTGSGNLKSHIDAKRTPKSTEQTMLDKHCDSDGLRGCRWDIAVDGRLSPFFPGWFETLRRSARVQFVNARKSDYFVNSKHPRGEKYPTDRAIADHRRKASTRSRS